jgi:hypothetical protein
MRRHRSTASLTAGMCCVTLLVHCGGAGNQQPGTGGAPCNEALPACDSGFICLNGQCEDALGKSWSEREVLGVSNLMGTWTRVGTTQQFVAIWTNPTMVTSNVIIFAEGYQISVERLGTWAEPSFCSYSGTLTPDGLTVAGSYRCVGYGPGSWTASITR